MPEYELEHFARLKRGISWAEIKNSMDIGGCIICNVMIKSLKKYFEFLLYEYALDATVHKKNLASFGMCNTHTYLLKEVEEKLNSDGLNIAVLYETLFQKEEKILNKIYESVEETKDVSSIRRKKIFISNKKQILRELIPKGICVGCQQQKESESFYTHEIIRIYKDEEFRNKYEKSESLLCRNHFLFLLSEADTTDVIKYFISTQRMKIETLHNNLKGFIQNHDYRLKGKMTEKENISWKFALEYFGFKNGLGKALYNDLLISDE